MITDKIQRILNDKGPGSGRITWGERLRGLGDAVKRMERKTATVQLNDTTEATYSMGLLACTRPGQITRCYVGAVLVPTNANATTLAINNHDSSLNSNKNVLSATNVNLLTLTTSLEPEEQTLSGTNANLRFDAGDMIAVTVVAGAVGGGAVGTGITCTIEYVEDSQF